MTAYANHINYRTATDQRPAPTRTATAPAAPARAGPAESPHRGQRGWWAAMAVVGGATLVAGTVVLIVDANTETTPTAPAERTVAQQLVEESIEQSLAERTAAVELPSVGSPPFAGGSPQRPVELPSVGSPPFVGGSQSTEFGTSQRLVEESIQQSLAERTAAVELPSVGSPPFAGGSPQRPVESPATFDPEAALQLVEVPHAPYSPVCDTTGPC